MTSKNFTVKYRRKREQKTDYQLRRKLLLSDLPRLVVRKSLTSFIAQIYNYTDGGDKLVVAAHSKQLGTLGWKYSGSSMPAAYLVGLICGSKAKSKGVKKVVVDFGLYRILKGSKLYSVIRGVIDGGIEVLCSSDVLPSEEVCSGKRIADYAKLLLKEDKNAYDKQFSKYLKNAAKPEDIEKIFSQVKEAIKKQKW